ncbi:MAG: trypsin-like serine protease [Bdellovibrionales bacterium]|nr:trypsin-like serine protease [Bdellovibrionales bacterium]
MKKYFALILTSATFLFIDQALPQSLTADFSTANDSTQYVCRVNEGGEVELFTAPRERGGLWNPTDYNSELNDNRRLRNTWRKKFQSSKDQFGDRSPRTRRAKQRWRGFRRNARALRECGKSLAISVNSNPCLEIAPETTSFGRGTLRIFNGRVCNPANSSVVELELVFSFATGGCSGTLLNEYTVLTAAHCVESKPKRIRIRSGSTVVDAVDYQAHPKYNAFSFFNIEQYDVAIIRTNSPISGPTSQIVSGSIATGETAIIAGYGLDEFGTSGTLKATALELAYVDSDTIATRYTRRQPDGNTCFGDSGGPLFVNRFGEWVIAGITSNGDRNDCSYGDVSRYANLTFPEVRDFLAPYLTASIFNLD